MQVFLPYSDFYASVESLDSKRLGNQIHNEAYVLMRGGWPNHPAAKIWAGYHHALSLYALAGLDVLKARGYEYPRWYTYYEEIASLEENTGLPAVVGYEPFHASHRSQLLKKNPKWYSQFGWKELPGEFSYVWSKP